MENRLIKSVLGCMLVVLVALLPGCGDDASPTRPRNGELVLSELAVKTLGTYTFYCSVPEHREQGMEGSLKVTRRPTPATSSSGNRSSGY